MADIIIATATGFKVVEPRTNKIIKHVGTEAEIKEHQKAGFGVNKKSGGKTEKELRTEIEAEFKAKYEKKAEQITPLKNNLVTAEFQKLSKNKKKKYQYDSKTKTHILKGITNG